MSLYLYGVILEPESVNFGPIGFDQGNVKTVPLGNLAAVVGSSPRQGFNKVPKEELIPLLLSHQQTLETVMKRFFVLPFKFGTVFKDEAELTWVVENGRPLILKTAELVKGCAEIDVIATWDVKQVLQEISEEDPEISACKKEMAEGQGDRAFVGMLLANALNKRAEDWRRNVTKVLETKTMARVDHDLFNDGMLLNTSFLIRGEGEKEFYHSVEEIDRTFERKLNFKCVGPLPPYSFATISLKRFNPVEVQEAAKVLGLNGQARLAEVKKTYKERSRDLHPDRNPEVSPEKFERLNKAYELLADYCKEGGRSLEKEAVESYVRLEAVGGS